MTNICSFIARKELRYIQPLGIFFLLQQVDILHGLHSLSVLIVYFVDLFADLALKIVKFLHSLVHKSIDVGGGRKVYLARQFLLRYNVHPSV